MNGRMSDMISNEIYDKYLVYPNESIDKLTVNRTFGRIFDSINAKSDSSSIVLKDATDNSYGKAKFSAADSYRFESAEDEDYGDSMLTIPQLHDLYERISDRSVDMLLTVPDIDGVVSPLSGENYWIRTSYADSKFVFMPNGVNIVTCAFEFGFDGITNMIGDSSIYGDVVVPVHVTSYGTTMDVDRDTQFNLSDYVDENVTDSAAIWNLANIDGKTIDVPLLTPVGVTLRHNRCDNSEYSTYKQSYVEICLSAKLSIKSLFKENYSLTKYMSIGEDSSVIDEDELEGEMHRTFRLFTQKPTVMSQLCFYNTESNPAVLFGKDDRLSGGTTSDFPSHNRMSQKPLYEVDGDGIPISPLNGSVIVKKVENIFDRTGNIVDNVIHFDVIYKFMAGSPSDPEMEFAMKSLNSRSRVQFAIIGV